MSTLQLNSISPISTKVFLALTGALIMILSTPTLSQAKEGSLQDLAQGLDDFAPNVPEKPLRVLVPDATPSTTSAPPHPASDITPISPAKQASATVVPTPSAPNPELAVPADWSHHEMAGLSFATPPDWSIIEERYDNLAIGDADKATTKGVMLAIGVQRDDPNDEKLPPEMKSTPLEDTDLGGHIFSHSIIQGKLQGIKTYTQMFFSKEPYVKTSYSDENYAMVSLSVMNLDPDDYKEIFAMILASIKSTAPEKQISLPQGTKSYLLGSQTSQNQIMPQEESADKYNRSKLHKAVLQGDLEKINYLLNSGEDVNIKDKLGRTPLHYAASQGNIDVAKFLLEKGADINSLDYARQWTPLFFAYFMERAEMVEYLIASGANTTIKDKSGKLASDYKKLNFLGSDHKKK